VNKLRIGVIYGGRSGEHEVSLASAAAVFKNLDQNRYEAVPIRIEKDGRWSLPQRAPMLISAADVIEAAKSEESTGLAPGDAPREAHLLAHPGAETLMTIDRHNENPIVQGSRSTSSFPCCTVRTGRTARSRGCSSWRTSRTWAPACSPPPSAWTRR